MLPDFIQGLRHHARRASTLSQCGLMLTALLLTGNHHAQAQGQTPGYPNKPLRFLLGFAPGGASDIVARIVGARLSDALGQPVVIDNRPAASGAAAAGLIARTPPDGYSMLLAATSTMAVNPSLYKNLPYDSLKDFTYVANFVSMPNVLVVHPSVAAKSVTELITLAKAEGGKLAYASAGIGSANHFTAALFSYLAKIQMTHVPYKGGGPALIDVTGGQVPVMFGTIVSALPYVKAGRLRPLGVTSAQRSPSLPEVPTIAEAGLPGYESTIWYGMVMPAGVPRPILSRLSSEVDKLLQAPDVKDRFNTLGANVFFMTPERFTEYVQAEIKKWRVVVQATGMRVD
jgi:tripartite-type tricarboxylate transporter receptor subunit TctC